MRDSSDPVTIGADARDDQNAAALRRMVERGHEVANHSLDHLYDLSRQPHDEVRRQIVEASTAIEAATGTMPSGFRARVTW